MKQSISNEAVVLKAYGLLKYAIPLLSKLPRDQKYVLGDRVEVRILEVLENIILAYYSPRAEKGPILQRVNIQLEQLRYLVRLLHDMQYISHDKYGHVAQAIDEVGRMCGGWRKSLS
jgi:hypothetical protein